MIWVLMVMVLALVTCMIMCDDESDVDDCAYAINHTLASHPQLHPEKIALMGYGYAATVALKLSARDARVIPTVLINPISDIGAMASSVDLSEWPYHVMGVNYSMASVPSDILTAAWAK